MTDWQIVLSLILPAWFLQNCIHEGSHILIAHLLGWKILEFKPYPHKHRGRFYFARYSADSSTGWKPKYIPRFHALYGAPFSAAVYWILLLVGVKYVLGIFDINVSVYFAPFILVALVDMIWWIRGLLFGSEVSDGQRWKKGVILG